MALSKTDRFVYVGESHLSTFRNSFSAPSMVEILSDLTTRRNAASIPTYEIENGKRIYRLRDIREVGDNCYCLLVSFSNEDIPDNVNEEKTSGKLRELTREGNESPALSAHVLIRCNEEISGNATYATIVENVNGLALTNIYRFIRYILKETLSKDRKDKTDKRLKKYYPIIQFAGHSSKTIENVLQGDGKLEGIVFSKTSVRNDGMGEKTYPVKEISEVELKLKHKINGKGSIDWIKRQVERRREDYDDAKIRIEDESGRTKTSKLDLHLDDVTKDFFVLQEHLTGFASDLRTCEDNVRSDMVEKMKLTLPRKADELD